MGGIKAFIVFSVAAFYLPIMPGCKRTDQLVPNTMLLQLHLKECGFVATTIGSKAFGELLSVIGLHTFDGKRKGFY